LLSIWQKLPKQAGALYSLPTRLVHGSVCTVKLISCVFSHNLPRGQLDAWEHPFSSTFQLWQIPPFSATFLPSVTSLNPIRFLATADCEAPRGIHRQQVSRAGVAPLAWTEAIPLPGLFGCRYLVDIPASPGGNYPGPCYCLAIRHFHRNSTGADDHDYRALSGILALGGLVTGHFQPLTRRSKERWVIQSLGCSTCSIPCPLNKENAPRVPN
jgi:hypothetical protein